MCVEHINVSHVELKQGCPPLDFQVVGWDPWSRNTKASKSGTQSLPDGWQHYHVGLGELNHQMVVRSVCSSLKNEWDKCREWISHTQVWDNYWDRQKKKTSRCWTCRVHICFFSCRHGRHCYATYSLGIWRAFKNTLNVGSWTSF